MKDNNSVLLMPMYTHVPLFELQLDYGLHKSGPLELHPSVRPLGIASWLRWQPLCMVQ